MQTHRLKYLLRGLRALLLVCTAGFGLTLFNAMRLMFTSRQMRAEVSVSTPQMLALSQGHLHLNSGTYLFSSANLLDRIVFRHTYENWDFVQSLFTFITCGLLLITVNGIQVDGPFTRRTSRRIMLIGGIFIVYGLLNVAAAGYMRARVAQLAPRLSLQYVSFPADLTHIKVGVFVLIFSLIYRIGATYQEENQLTV